MKTEYHTRTKYMTGEVEANSTSFRSIAEMAQHILEHDYEDAYHVVSGFSLLLGSDDEVVTAHGCTKELISVVFALWEVLKDPEFPQLIAARIEEKYNFIDGDFLPVRS